MRSIPSFFVYLCVTALCVLWLFCDVLAQSGNACITENLSSEEGGNNNLLYLLADKVLFGNDRAYLSGISAKEGDYRMKADRLLYDLGNQRADLRGNLLLTTCQSSPPAWYISADKVTIDGKKGLIRARGSWLRVGGFPILYLPVYTFSIDDQDDKAKEGFLLPKLSFSSSYGLNIGVPIRWETDAHKEITIIPQYFTHRSAGLGLDFSYLYPHESGRGTMLWVPNDRKTSEKRYFVNYSHQADIGNQFQLNLDIKRVSDINFQDDFPSEFDLYADTYIHSQIRANLALDDWQLQAFAETLQQAHAQSDIGTFPIYQRRPFLGISKNFFNPVSRIRTRVHGQFASFDEKFNLIEYPSDVKRFYTSVDVEWLNSWQGIDLIPTIGASYVDYDSDGGLHPGNSHRSSVYFSFSAARNWWTYAKGGRYSSVWKPQLYYLLVPNKAQDTFPLLDSEYKEPSYETLFTANRFFSVDRIGDANRLAFGVQTRWYDSFEGIEFFRASIGQAYSFRSEKVRIGRTADDDRFSDIVADVTINKSNKVKFLASLVWDPNANKAVRQSYNISLYGKDKRRAGIFYRYQDDNFLTSPRSNGFEQAGFGLQTPIVAGWKFSANFLRNLRNGRNLIGYVGLEYQASCWNFGLGRRRIVQNVNSISGSLNSDNLDYDTVYTVDFNLFGSGDTPSSKIDQDIASGQVWWIPGL